MLFTREIKNTLITVGLRESTILLFSLKLLILHSNIHSVYDRRVKTDYQDLVTALVISI